jgi:hypothetical protein
MSINGKKFWLGFIVFAAASSWAATGHADDRPWRVEKATGEVWVAKSDNQKVSLGTDTDLTVGDSIRTGRNGRVLLVRGEERIVISPNSAIGIPAEGKDGFPTTITQQAGTIFLEVEKKNVQHFEVETPYLAAVVKGTQFKVSVNRFGAKVDVVRGQVQVADFKSGDNVLVLPGQAANVKASGQGGLSLTGKGNLNSIEHGAPRVSSVQALVVPKRGLGAPANATKLREVSRDAKAAFAKDTFADEPASRSMKSRVGSPLGEVKPVNNVTGGQANSGKKNAGGMSGISNQATSENPNSEAGGLIENNALLRGTVGTAVGNGGGAAGNAAGVIGSSGGAVGNAGGVVGTAGGVVSNAGGVLGNTVSGTGAAVGNVVGGTLGGVGGTVAGVGGTVSNLGTTVSNVGLGSVGGTVGNVVSGAGGTVSNLGGVLGVLGGKKN